MTDHTAASSQTTSHHPRRVMSGMRPTGNLHLGHYVGVLKNWIALQSQYPCFFMIADWHALTTKADSTSELKQHIIEVALDWLASGVDPEKATIYIQSQVPEIAQIHLLLSMVTPNKWVETDPTLKDMVKMTSEELTYGLLGYPVLQTADILAPRGSLVPVGKDQLAHLEISRDIVTRLNHRYGTDFFPAPQPLLTEVSLLSGLDGRKMGKSYGNAIYINDSEDDTWQKVKQGVTDLNRVKREQAGNPDNCQVIFQYYKVFASSEVQSITDKECRSATRGCVDCKKQLAEIINEQFRAIRQKRSELANNLDYVHQVLIQGSEKAQVQAHETLRGMQDIMHLWVS